MVAGRGGIGRGLGPPAGGVQVPFGWERPDGFPDNAAAWSSAVRLMGSFHLHYTTAGGYWPNTGVTYQLHDDCLPQSSIHFDALVDHLCRALHGRRSTSLVHGDRAYYAARPAIAVPQASLLVRDNMFGLHPGLKPLESTWTAGKFAAVHATGLPQPNRSHFSAIEEIEDADLGSEARTGWINRLIGLTADRSPLEAVMWALVSFRRRCTVLSRRWPPAAPTTSACLAATIPSA